MNKKLSEIFNFSDFLDNTALITKNEKITYKQLKSMYEEFSTYIEENSVVFLVPSNDIESIVSYLSIYESNSVCTLINDIKEDTFLTLLDTYKPHYYIAKEESIILEENYEIVFRFKNYVLVKTNFIVEYEVNKNLALLLTTSGSTGSPKLVKLSHENIVSNTKSISKYLNIISSDRTITTLPMYYTYGLSIINTHLANGASIVLTDSSLLNRDFWNLLKEYKVNNFGGVPYTYEILDKIRFDSMNLDSIKYITQAGGKLNIDLAKKFVKSCKNKKIDFYIMYGQAEATARMSYLPLKYLDSYPNSIGVPIPDGKFKIVDDNNCEITTPEMIGELVYFGNNVSMGYATNYKELITEDINNGKLFTGDLAQYDKNKLLYIMGRKNRFCKVYGHRVNLDEVESILKKFGFNSTCICNEDKIYIFILTNIEEEEIITKISEYTRINRTGFKVKMINEIPRNQAGKILYSQLVEYC